jgi:hypothetical protein
MKIRSRLLVAALGLAVAASAGAASAETRWEQHHPRQDQVLDRDAHLRHEIRAERRAGEISPVKAHRLLVKDRQIAREDHAIAHANGGYITPREQHIMNRQETGLAHRVPG